MMEKVDMNAAVRAFDLEGYCQEHAGELVSHGQYLLVCPVCFKDKLTVHVNKSAWHCWVCDRGYNGQGRGGLIDLIKLFDRLTTKEAVEKIKQGGRRIILNLGAIEGDVTVQVDSAYAAAPDILPPYPHSLITGILPYMQKRGITIEDAHAFGLYVGTGGRYQNRLIFPVWEEGRHVYYQARAMWEANEHVPRHPDDRYIKSLNPPRDHQGAPIAVSSDVLMNLDQARHFPRIALVEGPIDCVKAGPSAVCTFGKKISMRQVAKLRRAGVRAIDFMWDGPGPKEPHGALPEMQSYAPMLVPFFDVRIVRIPWGDPGERTRSELDQLRQAAVPVGTVSKLAYL